MGLSAGLEDVLEGPFARIFECVEIVLNTGATLRLLAGSGLVTFSSKTFTGADDTYGVLAGLELSGDGVGNESQSLRLVITPPSNSAGAILSQPGQQGSTIAYWFGAVDPLTHAVIDEPYLMFSGELDQPKLRVGKSSRSVTLEFVDALDRFFDEDEGIRLNDSFHESVWPGEKGLEFVTEAANRKVPWMQDAPRPAVLQSAASQTGPSPAQLAQQATAGFFGR
jgi:hypothetical protein